MDNLQSCAWCYQDDYPIAFATYKGKTFCGYCVQYHGRNSIVKLHKKYLKIREVSNES
jgi:recombinational DNA repair protein (RecF pathway)